MLVNLQEVTKEARRKGCAVPGFTAFNIESAQAIIEAAEEVDAPVILGQAQLFHEYGDIEICGPVMAEMARRAKVPVCLHLDHGTTLEYILKAVKAGYTSVMADFSELPFEENARLVKMCVDMLKDGGISVEGLMGRMPNLGEVRRSGLEKLPLESYFTVPEEAARFVEITGVNALTVSFGTVHGMMLAQPHLDFDRLADLHAMVGCILVMHGSSGVRPDEIKKAIQMGLRKINVYTKLSTSAQPAILKLVKQSQDPLYYHEIVAAAKTAMREAAKEQILLFRD